MAGGTTASASTTISGDDFYAENLTFDNSFSRDQPHDATGDMQAVALLSLGDRLRCIGIFVFRIGAQDTLYANSKTCHSTEEIAAAKPCRAARQYFSDCYIEGHVDFIFGDAKAVFDHCEIHANPQQLVNLTAQSRVYQAEDSGYSLPRLHRHGRCGRNEHSLGTAMAGLLDSLFRKHRLQGKAEPGGLGRVGRQAEDQHRRRVRLAWVERGCEGTDRRDASVRCGRG